jgi:heterodisulfide reductase subunit A
MKSKGNTIPLPLIQDNKLVGAVMVVGGGIAGMQASLDLADAGYKVYLVEKKPAIGGHMAALDKTFPTNDCAMCTISPRLVSTAGHNNIELLTNTELLKLDGEPGHFKATIRQNPRYIDLSKCTACGDCSAVCPITVSDGFNNGLNQRKAVYKFCTLKLSQMPLPSRKKGYHLVAMLARQVSELKVILP